MPNDGVKKNTIDITEKSSKPLILVAEDDDITRAIAVKTLENLVVYSIDCS